MTKPSSSLNQLSAPAIHASPRIPSLRPLALLSTKPATVQVDADWRRVERVLTTHQHKPDLAAARLLYSAVAAHCLSEANPVWPMMVAPPGAGKTALLDALIGLPGVHPVDEFTANTFISGQLAEAGKMRDRSPSLLHRIGQDGIIVAADFSTLLASRADKRDTIFAQLRRIYDGRLSKEFGTGENTPDHAWEGRITFVAAVTTEIDQRMAAIQSLGERFIMVRFPRAGGEEVAMMAMGQRSTAFKAELAEAVHRVLSFRPSRTPHIPREISLKIANLAEVAVLARTHVPRHEKHVIDIPEAESATRLPQQFAQLCRGSALIGGRDSVNDSDYELIKKAAFDSMIPLRRRMLDTLIRGGKPSALGLAGSSLHYLKEDLQVLDLMTDDGLSEKAVTFLTKADCI